MHDDSQIQLSTLGTMNGTEYHSSVSAYSQPVTTTNPMFSPRQQVVNSRTSATIWQASQQPGMTNFAPLGSNHSASHSHHDSASRGMKLLVNSLSGGRFSISMLENDPNFLFANLMQHRRNSSLEDVKREFFPILLHKICLTGIDPCAVSHLLYVILTNSLEVLRMRCFDHVILTNSLEVLRMRCFDQVLNQRIMEVNSHRVVTQNEREWFAVSKPFVW